MNRIYRKLRRLGRALQWLFQAWLATRRPGANTLRARVMTVSDGDTLQIRTVAGRETIRIAGIDAPELRPPVGHDPACEVFGQGQAYGEEARQALAGMVLGRTVRLRFTGRDIYGRSLAEVFVGETDVGFELVRRGLACHYKHFARQYQDVETLNAYRLAHLSAMARQAGQWEQPDVIPPWTWRRRARSRMHRV